MRRIVFRDFRIADAGGDFVGSLVVEDGRIAAVGRGPIPVNGACLAFDGSRFPGSAVLMPAFIDLHAHFREPAFPAAGGASPAETLESGSLAAAAGGFASVVCMANTVPATDSLEKVLALKARAAALGLVDLFPAMSLTMGMEGTGLSGIAALEPAPAGGPLLPVMLSEDGRDVADDALFLAAMAQARRLGLPVSCHCDLGGSEAAAVRRAIALGMKAGCHIHIAHVSTGEAVGAIRTAKADTCASAGFRLTCETTPHHIGATDRDAERMGSETFGRVNPPLAGEDDRAAIVAAILDGTIDAVATDHAPHAHADKASGAPGFVGLETAFAVCMTTLGSDARRISALMSAGPADILGLGDRGRLAEGLRADLVIADVGAALRVDPAGFRSRGRCTPFAGRELRGKVMMTMAAGRIAFDGGVRGDG